MKRAAMLGLAFLSTAAFAQDEVASEQATITYRSVTELGEDAFRDLNVEGELVRPEGTVVVERRRAAFAPMISLRTNFTPEMAESVADVK